MRERGGERGGREREGGGGEREREREREREDKTRQNKFLISEGSD